MTPAIHIGDGELVRRGDELDAALDGKDYVYSRISAQNTVLLEEAVAALEGAEACVAYASGMAALRAVFEAQDLKAGRPGGDARRRLRRHAAALQAAVRARPASSCIR